LAVVAAAWVADPAVAWAVDVPAVLAAHAVAWAAVAEADSAAWAAAAATAAAVAAGDKRRAETQKVIL
jgi:hypothetical protein